MPDDWANWDDTWAGLKEKYGLEHTDVDLSSAEELSMFEAEKNNATKDIGDVGETYGAVAEDQGLTLKYKTSYWDEIPDWAKDDDGDWVVAYYGTMGIITNKKLVSDAPTSFADLLEGDYMVSVGDVARSSMQSLRRLMQWEAMKTISSLDLTFSNRLQSREDWTKENLR